MDMETNQLEGSFATETMSMIKYQNHGAGGKAAQ